MRKREREITDKAQLDELLMRSRVCRLGMFDGQWPYVVPVNYGYAAGKLYFHSALKGKKIDVLQQNPRVCFEVDLDVEVVAGELPCEYTTNYKSVIGFGLAVFVSDEEEKLEALKIIMRRHGGPVTGFRPEALARTGVVRIDVVSMTGKANPPLGDWG